MAVKYKVWIEIEKISNEGESGEKYKDVSSLPLCVGTFKSRRDAEAFVHVIEPMCERVYKGGKYVKRIGN